MLCLKPPSPRLSLSFAGLLSFDGFLLLVCFCDCIELMNSDRCLDIPIEVLVKTFFYELAGGGGSYIACTCLSRVAKKLLSDAWRVTFLLYVPL